MAIAIAIAIAVAGAVSEQAAAALERCGSVGERTCLRLAVPIDRTGVTPGTVKLRIDRVRARRPATRAPLFLIAGGPGQSALAAFGGRIDGIVGAARRSRDIVVVDLRGTGRSGALDCPAVQRGELTTLASCAAALGPRRDFYTSADMADDLDAVRAALGAPRIALLGISYGTHVALTYARRHPDSVERMILDSPVASDGVDLLERVSMRALPRVAAAACGRRACRFMTRDPAADLRAVAARVERAPLRGRVTLPSGRQRPVRLSGRGLLALLRSGYSDPIFSMALPGALRRAAQGDPALLLRVAVAHSRREVQGPLPTRRLSRAAHFATLCSDSALPWSAGTAPGQRVAATRALVDALGPGPFAPFGPRTAAALELPRVCARWSASARPAAPQAPLPDVPALALVGNTDVRAPLEDARDLVAQLPRAQLLVVDGVGHSVLDGPFCPARVVARFLDGRAAPRCRSLDRTFLLPPPSSFSQLPGRNAHPRLTRTVGAVSWTILDAMSASLMSWVMLSAPGFERGRLVLRVGGLRGGSYAISERWVRLRRVRVIPGVVVSGMLFPGPRGFARGRLRVASRLGVRGRLALRGNRVVGRLGGRRVSAPLSLMGEPVLAVSQVPAAAASYRAIASRMAAAASSTGCCAGRSTSSGRAGGS